MTTEAELDFVAGVYVPRNLIVTRHPDREGLYTIVVHLLVTRTVARQFNTPYMNMAEITDALRAWHRDRLGWLEDRFGWRPDTVAPDPKRPRTRNHKAPGEGTLSLADLGL